MRTILSVSLAIALAGYVIFAWLTVDRRGDDARIRSLFADTVVAVNKRDLGGAMRWVSEEYKDENGLNHDRLRMLVAQGLRVEKDFTASGELLSLNVQGDEAKATVHALVKDESGETLYDRNLSVSLRKESGRHAWFVSTTVWRVVSVRYLDLEQLF